ncbi:hypothetical protein B0H19DRAFT_1365279 [Mycena capillaripes]|nr:hypothetical protein B0H19DRAFT_1365279 [Mycena capillaripes]
MFIDPKSETSNCSLVHLVSDTKLSNSRYSLPACQIDNYQAASTAKVPAKGIATGRLVFIWDILDNLVDDYHLFSKHKFRISGAVYLLSRIASFIYVLGFTLFAAYPLGDCQAALVVFDCFVPVASGATALLFVFRVPSYLGIAGTTLTLHDTSVFFAISFRLLSNSHIEYTPGQRVQALFRGANLHALSKALLRDGQKYYMMTIIANVLMISMVIVACRVYRNAKLHYVHIPHLSLPVTGGSNIEIPRFSFRLSAQQSASHMDASPTVPQNVSQPTAVVDPSPPKELD